MDAIEKRARELLAAEVDRDAAAMPGVEEVATIIREGGDGNVLFVPTALRAIIAAITPREGQDQNLLELAAAFETCIPFLPPAGRRNIGKAVDQLRNMGMGYVLMPVEPNDDLTIFMGGHDDASRRRAYDLLLAARPEVP